MAEPEPTVEPEPSHGVPEAEFEPEPEPEAEPEPEPEAEDATSEPESEAEFTSTSEMTMWISLYAIFIILILAGNIVIIGILMKNKKAKRSATNLFLISLLISRACIAVFVVPARITGIFSEEYLGSAMCKLCHFSAMASTVSSVLSTTGVALCKYLEIVHKRTDFNVKRTLAIIGGVWLASHVYATRKLVLTDLTEVDPTAQDAIVSCTIDSDYKDASNVFTFIDLVALFIVPFLVILYCYVKVIRAFNASQVHVTKPDPISGTLDVSQEFLRNAQMLVSITLLFTICTSAPYIWRLYLYWADGLPSDYMDIDRSVYLCSYANPWVNVLVFIYFRTDVRKGLKSMCRCCWGKGSPQVSPGHTGHQTTEVEVISYPSKALDAI